MSEDSNGHGTDQGDGDPASRLLDKLGSFVADLDDEERQAFAALLAPGVALAHEPDAEVVGFSASEWLPSALPDRLGEVIRERGLRIEGL
ncbi:MAG: hypothetical protein U5K29_09295 [Acidimicrobiales bacterium]|nr:hypothetical protein [Acidimicrobiales bacterium]